MSDKNENSGFSFEDEGEFFQNHQPEEFMSNGLESADPGVKSDRKKINTKQIVKSVFEWLDVVVASLVVVVLVFTFVFRIVAIDGDSMLPTLHEAERVIISDLFYEPKRGDIVVVSRNMNNSADSKSYQQPIIKRVIATEGQTVDIDFNKGVVFVDGVALEENYTLEPTYRKLDFDGPVRVKENCVFVLGDNRNDSLDSRSSSIGDNGMIDEKYILGRAVLRVFPLNKFGGLN